jgi:hypothetical protein
LSIGFIPLLCFNQFQHPRKKLEGALSIPFNLDEIINFGNIEEEILSRSNLYLKLWGKIEIGLICYQLSSAAKADHFEINSADAVFAFVSAAKHKKNVQLCVYQVAQKRQVPVLYGSTVNNQQEFNSNQVYVTYPLIYL